MSTDKKQIGSRFEAARKKTTLGSKRKATDLQTAEASTNLPLEREENNTKIAKDQNTKPVYDQSFPLYLTRAQIRKLRLLEIEIEERTGKNTDRNKMIRTLIDKCTLEDFLQT